MLRKEASLDSLEEGNEAKQPETRLISSGMETFLLFLATLRRIEKSPKNPHINNTVPKDEYFSMPNRQVIVMVKLLKIIFVHVRIVTGIILGVLTLINFSQPKEAQKPHTGIKSFPSFTVFIETLGKYFEHVCDGED